jgi:hypothetical protein
VEKSDSERLDRLERAIWELSCDRRGDWQPTPSNMSAIAQIAREQRPKAAEEAEHAQRRREEIQARANAEIAEVK